MRQIINVVLWAVMSTDNSFNFSNKVNYNWYKVTFKDPNTGAVTEAYIEGVDHLDAYAKAQKQLAEEEARERERPNKTT